MPEAPASQPVVYPESDGKPMAETDLHRSEMLALLDALEERYRAEANVYVTGNNFLYYEEGNPKACDLAGWRSTTFPSELNTIN